MLSPNWKWNCTNESKHIRNFHSCLPIIRPCEPQWKLSILQICIDGESNTNLYAVCHAYMLTCWTKKKSSTQFYRLAENGDWRRGMLLTLETENFEVKQQRFWCIFFLFLLFCLWFSFAIRNLIWLSIFYFFNLIFEFQFAIVDMVNALQLN